MTSFFHDMLYSCRMTFVLAWVLGVTVVRGITFCPGRSYGTNGENLASNCLVSIFSFEAWNSVLIYVSSDAAKYTHPAQQCILLLQRSYINGNANCTGYGACMVSLLLAV
jgi:hypothetical protein